MDSVLSIARIAFIQQLRNRLYLVVLLFGAMILAASLFLGVLAADQEGRVILDLGLAATEVFGLLAALFGSVTLVLEEMESRTIYLILTRPLSRSHYVLGRALGLVAAVGTTMGFMAALHWVLLFSKGVEFSPVLILAYGFMLLKVMVMAALAMFFSLVSSSAVTSVVITVSIWMLGHFVPELEFMAAAARNPVLTACVKVLGWTVPNLGLLNVRDLLAASLPAGMGWWGAGYACAYSSACLALTMAVFSRKEF